MEPRPSLEILFSLFLLVLGIGTALAAARTRSRSLRAALVGVTVALIGGAALALTQLTGLPVIHVALGIAVILEQWGEALLRRTWLSGLSTRDPAILSGPLHRHEAGLVAGAVLLIGGAAVGSAGGSATQAWILVGVGAWLLLRSGVAFVQIRHALAGPRGQLRA